MMRDRLLYELGGTSERRAIRVGQRIAEIALWVPWYYCGSAPFSGDAPAQIVGQRSLRRGKHEIEQDKVR